MKKFISIVLILVLCAVMFTGCGNHKVIDTKWTFNYAYISLPTGVVEVKVKYWSEDTTTITIQAEDGNVYCAAPVNIIMTKDKL